MRIVTFPESWRNNPFLDLAPLSKQVLSEYIEDAVDYGILKEMPDLSIVIVAFRTGEELIKCLDGLKKQSYTNFETLVIDNGGNDQILGSLCNFSIHYFRLRKNYKPCLARNIGIAHSRGAVVCFLDDDAIPDSEYIQQHLLALRQPGISGVRGKILPKTNSIYNDLAYHYNLGDNVVPSYVDMENNASFRREILMQVGGFNPNVFAGEGAELSYRIVKQFGNPRSMIYWPGAIVYHDFSTNFRKYFRKTLRGAKMQVYLERIYPDFWEFVESYHPLPLTYPPKPAHFKERIQLAFLRRAGKFLRNAGVWWYRKQEII